MKTDCKNNHWIPLQWLAGEMVHIDAGKLMWDLVKMTVIPVAAGLAWHHWVQNRVQWLSRIMPYCSMAGIIAMTLLTIAVGRDNLLRLGSCSSLFVSCTARRDTSSAILCAAVCG